MSTPLSTEPDAVRNGRSKSAVSALIVVALAAICVALLLRSGDSALRTGPPGSLRSGSAAGYNVLLITLDTTRADHLGCYGCRAADTSVLDALADGGLRFDDAVTTAPVTLPAHASILTGLYPPNHGVRNNAEFSLDEQHVTLAEVLREHGYATVAFVAAFVLDARFGLNQGFDLYDDRMPPPAQGFGQDLERPAEAITDAAARWLGGREADAPFFAWVHYFDPHYPYVPHEERYRGRPYDGEITYMDRHLGRLLETLERHGLRERTLIIAVADHGESLGEHGEQGHSRLIYEGAMRVPLIISCPSLLAEPEVVDDVLVSVADVFPTVLDLLSIPHGACDGISLLRARGHRGRSVYMETMVTYLDNGWAPLFALREHGRKFIMAPRREYYDLRADPREQSNLWDDLPQREVEACARLEAELSELLARWPSAEEIAGMAAAVDPETADRLESLGYVSADSPDGSIGQLDPKDMMPAWGKIGEARRLSKSGDYPGAAALLREVLAFWPNDRTALRQLGTTYLRMGRTWEAESTLREAIEIKPAADVCLLLAQILIAKGRHSEATELLSQASDLEPLHGGVCIARGDLLRAQGRREQALAAYEKAQQVDPYRAKTVAQIRIESLRKRVVPSP